MNINDYDTDEYRAYCEEYAENNPIRENGVIVGYEYPNGIIVYCDDFEEDDDGITR